MEKRFKDIERLIKDAGVEQPSADFLQHVMNSIETSNMGKPLLYQPLISRKAWLIISLLIVGMLFSLPFLSDGTSILDTLDLSFMNINNVKTPLSDFKFYITTVYGTVFLTLLFMVQVSLIKRRRDKMFS